MTYKLHPLKSTVIDQLITSEVLKTNDTKSISLLTGLAGEILTQVIAYKSLRVDCLKKIKTEIQKLYNLIESSESLSSTFCDGLSGVGWLILYLNEIGLLDVNPDSFLEDLDEFIEKNLINFLNEKNYDLLHGAVGIGLYFLKRKRKDLTGKIVKSLLTSSDKDNNEYKWVINASKSRYDFGLAHGQSGVLYFLGKCYIENVQIEECKIMILGIFHFYMKNMQPQATIGSYWPSFIPTKDYISGRNLFSKSRLAWCYGDLGILHTMLLVAKWTDNTHMYDKAIRLLATTTKRINIEDTLIEDSYFCHGSSGIAFIYQNLYSQTNDQTFKEAAEFWSREICKDLSDISLSKKLKKISALQPRGILLGKPGVLLTLISMENSNSRNIWKECFFMS